MVTGRLRGAAVMLETARIMVKKVLLICSARASKRSVARGKTTEALDRRFVRERVRIRKMLLAQSLLGELHAHVLIGQMLRVSQWEIVEAANARRNFEIAPLGNRPLGDVARESIAGKRLRSAAKHVAGKLIEQDDQRQSAVVLCFPMRKSAG